MDQATVNPSAAGSTRAALGANARAAARRLGLPAFLRWWLAELAPLVPRAPRNAMQRRRLRPVLAVQPDAAVLWEPALRDGALAWSEVARIPIKGDAAATAQAGRAAIERVTRLAYGGAVKSTRIAVALPPGQVLRKRIVLPAAVEENLKQTLAYDLDRHTPFRPEDLAFDAVVVARDGAKREITVDWTAALKTHVAEAKRLGESFGATVVVVRPDAPAVGVAPAPSKLNLLPPGERSEVAWWRRWQFWAPLTALLALAAIAVVLPIWQKRGYSMALNQQTDQAMILASASDLLRRELEQRTGEYNHVLTKKFAYPATVQLLEDLTKLMPDDTWLLQLELKSTSRDKQPHKELLVRGESGNAGRLVAAFEESKLFAETAPRSPTTKIQPGPGEIFDLGALLKPLPPPTPVALVVAPPTNGAGAAPDAAAPNAAMPNPAPPGAPTPNAPASAPSAGPGPVPANAAGPANAAETTAPPPMAQGASGNAPSAATPAPASAAPASGGMPATPAPASAAPAPGGMPAAPPTAPPAGTAAPAAGARVPVAPPPTRPQDSASPGGRGS